MLAKQRIFDGGFTREIAAGDVVAAAEQVTTLTTAGAGSLTAAMLTTSFLSRTGPGGAVADTVDTAANIIAALGNADTGDTYRWRYINNVGFAITVTGVTGVTVTNGVVNASSVKEFLITITNASPQQIFAAATTNGSAVVTGLTDAQTKLLTPGMLVTGTGIPGSTTVLSVQNGTGVTLSANATATNNPVALTFSPTVSILGIGQGLL